MPDSTTCLCTTASALATVCEVKDMADVIVRQARELFGADLTFVAVTDSCTGSCQVQGALGAISAELGLCFLPADLDRLVSLERLCDIHTVPLEVDRVTVGLVGIGWRSSHTRSEEEADRLAAYASVAAAALDSATRYEAGRTALSELTASYAAAESALHRARKQARAHEVLADALLGHGSADHLVNALADALEARVWLVDDGGQLLASSGSDEPLPDQPDLAVPVTTGSATGELALATTTTVGARERCILGLAAEVLSRLLQRPPAVGEDDDFAGRWAARVTAGEQLDGLLVVNVPPHLEETAIAELGALALELNGVSGSWQGWPTLVVCADHLDRTAPGVQRRLATAVAAPVLVCAHVVDLDGDPGARSHEPAVRACRLLAALGVASGVIRTDQLGIFPLLVGDDDGQELRSFIDRVLGPLIDYDAHRGTELLATVAAFFASSGSNVHTARALRVHLNTVLKRFARIDDILGPDWRTPEQAFELQLAVRIHQLAGAVQN